MSEALTPSPPPAPAPVQVRSLLGQVRPDRQTLLFSATMPKKVGWEGGTGVCAGVHGPTPCGRLRIPRRTQLRLLRGLRTCRQGLLPGTAGLLPARRAAECHSAQTRGCRARPRRFCSSRSPLLPAADPSPRAAPPPAPFPPTPSSTLEVERLVGDVLSNPVRISVGQLGAANEDVAQRVEVLEGGDGAKRAWLLGRLQVRDAAAAAAAWFLFWGGGAGPCCSCCQRVCRAAGAASIPQTALR